MNEEKLMFEFDHILAEAIVALTPKEKEQLLRKMSNKIRRQLYPEKYESRKKNPCPDCGKKQLCTWQGVHYYQVQCPKCGRYGPAKRTELEAAKAWNRGETA